jgi:T4 RnlA family RNA ligase
MNLKIDNMKMGFVIPTYDEAKNIVATTGELVFYESIQKVDGYKVSTFNYRLASYNDFVEHKANELRGMSFVFNEDGSLFNRYVLLHKFFNLNQVEETQLSLLKDVSFTAVHDKADGSVISFVRLPNGNVYAKTKMVIRDNPQATMAQEIYKNNPALKRLVDYTLDNNLVAVFELVSPFNRVVLKYDATDLVLTRLRDNTTGEYLQLETLGSYLDGVNIVSCETEKYSTWDDLLPLVETVEDKEGWVVTLSNGMLVKLKTAWYCSLHGLLSDYVYREDYLIDFTLDDKIDDLLGQIGETETEVRDTINIVSDKVNKYIINSLKEVDSLIDKYYNVYNSNRKDFALSEKNSVYFAIAIKALDGKDKLLSLKDFIKRKTYRLEDARHFVRTGTFRK